MYGMAYTMKFMLKLRPKDPVDYPVMAMEGLWWVKDGGSISPSRTTGSLLC